METPFAIYDALCAIAVPPEKVRTVVQSLEHDMALFATRSQFDQLDQFSGSRFELLRAEIAATRQRIEQDGRRFDEIDQRFERINERFENINERFERIDQRFEKIDQRFEKVDQRFEKVDQRFDQLAEQIRTLAAAAVTKVDVQRMITESEHRVIVRLASVFAAIIGVYVGLSKLF